MIRRTRSRAPHAEVNIPSPFHSKRSGGVKPSIVVLHSTESHNAPGCADLVAVGKWFQNPAAQVSSHVCTDGEGHSARYVPDEPKAWHCAGANSISLGVEQIGQAAQTSWPTAQLKETAKWIAFWSRKYGIPIQSSTVHGVCRHSDLGAAGGGHHDPGPAYPLDRVLRYAKWFSRYGWTD